MSREKIITIIALVAIVVGIGFAGPRGEESITGYYRFQNGLYENLTYDFQFQLPANWTEIKGTEGCGGPVFAPRELLELNKDWYDQKWFTDYGWITICGPYRDKQEIAGIATSTDNEDGKRSQSASFQTRDGVMRVYFYETGTSGQTEKAKIFDEMIKSLELGKY